MIKTRFGLFPLAMMGILSFGLAGCETLGLDDDDDDDDIEETRSDDRISRRVPADKDRLPSNADLITTNARDKVNFKADRDGTLYIFDDDTNRVAYTTQLQAGDRITFDPQTGRAELNNRSLFTPDTVNLNTSHDLKVYFSADSDFDSSRNFNDAPDRTLRPEQGGDRLDTVR